MSEYLVDIQHERLSFFTPAGEVKALNDVQVNPLLHTVLWD